MVISAILQTFRRLGRTIASAGKFSLTAALSLSLSRWDLHPFRPVAMPFGLGFQVNQSGFIDPIFI